MIVEFAQWVAPKLLRIRVCQGGDECKAYDHDGNIATAVHVDMRLTLAFLEAVIAMVKLARFLRGLVQ